MKKVKKINSHNKANSTISTDNEMSKLLILILVVALIFALFYVITLFATKNDNSGENNNNEDLNSTIQYEKILAGNILSQKDSEYYVLVYFNSDEYVNLYKNYLVYYASKATNPVPYYQVDMDDVFNKLYISEKSNLNVSNSSDFRFSQTALLRVKDSKVISSYEGKDQIEGKLGRMTK